MIFLEETAEGWIGTNESDKSKSKTLEKKSDKNLVFFLIV